MIKNSPRNNRLDNEFTKEPFEINKNQKKDDTKRFRKIKRPQKIYILILILLLILIGVWKCPKYLATKSGSENLLNKDTSQLVESIKKEVEIIDTITPVTNEVIKPVKEENPSTSKIPQEEIEVATTIPAKKEITPVLEKEKTTPIKETPTQVVTINKSIDNPSPRVSENSCTSRSILKIDKPSYQRCIAFSPDGSKFTVGNNNKYANVFNMKGKEVFKLIGHTGYVTATAYSPDGKYIATGSIDKTAKLWDANTGKLIKNLEGHVEAIRSIAFSPNGKQLVTGSLDKTAILWDIQSGNKLFHFLGHKLEISTTAFSPDGQYIVTGGLGNIIRLWDVKRGTALFSLEGHKGAVRDLIFSPNSKFIITVSGDKKIRIWNAQSGKHVLTMKGHEAPIRSVDVSSDGQRILTASGDNSIRIWELNSGIELCKIEGHSSAVNEARFHPVNHKVIVSVSNDKTIRMWTTELE